MRQCIAIIVLLSAAGAGADQVGPTPQMVTLTSDPWPPYVLGELGQDATGGSGVELMRTIFARLDGVEVRFPLVPWQRALQEVKQGRMDGIGILLKTPERERYMAYTDELFVSHDRVWYVQDRFPAGLNWRRLNDLRPYHIGVVRGHSYGSHVDTKLADGTLPVTKVTSAERLFVMLARGRVDLAFANESVGHTLARRHAPPGGAVAAARKALSVDVYHIAFSKRSPARRLIPAINRIIAELREEKLIDKIINGDRDLGRP